MYKCKESVRLLEKLIIVKKKKPELFKRIMQKIEWIRSNPKHRYKKLRYSMKGLKRIHIGHFVLIFLIDHEKKMILFEDFDHHDHIYKR